MTEPNFRTPDAQERNVNLIYRGVFADSPSAYLVLTPDLQIMNGNDAYLEATGQTREEVVDRFVFDVFPDNPDDPNATGMQNLMASFDRARFQRRRDRLPLQRYDVCRNGIWQRKFWYPSNWPILDDDGSVIAVIHHVREVNVSQDVGGLVEQTRRLLETSATLANDLEAVVGRLESQP